MQDFENWAGATEQIVASWRLPLEKIAISRYLQELIGQTTSLDAHYLPLGINFDVFHPEKYRGAPQGEIVIGGLYNTTPRKRFEDFVAVIERLNQRHVPARVALFGTDDTPKLTIPFDYEQTPNPERLRKLYNRCHVWLAMSEQEGQHVPPMEAMACGAVPVTTDIGGTRDYCLEGRTGFRVPVGGVGDAADRIEALLSDSELWKRLSDQGRRQIESMGSEKKNADRMLAIFEKAGDKGIFSFHSFNRNTWATLNAYGKQAGKLQALGEQEISREIFSGIAKTSESIAAEEHDPNLLGRHGRLYGGALAALAEFDGDGGSVTSDRLRRSFSYFPDRGETLQKLLQQSGKVCTRFYQSDVVFDGFLRIYLTLRCNLRCPYCVNDEVENASKHYRLPGPQMWCEALNRERKHIVFTGGEPFLYPHLEALINGLDRSLILRIYTNLSLDVTGMIKSLDREVEFYVSWHPIGGSRENLIRNLQAIRNHPLLSYSLHTIDVPETRDFLENDKAFFDAQGFRVDVDADQRGFEGAGQSFSSGAYCRKRIYLIAPDGNRYPCVSRLMQRKAPMENIFEKPLGQDICFSLCSEFGKCAPCDAMGETAIAVLGPEQPVSTGVVETDVRA